MQDLCKSGEALDDSRSKRLAIPDVIGYLEAYYQNLVLPVQQLYLRIPGAAEYWHELDVRLSSVLAGETKPKAALDDTYQTWEQITEHCGRESQKNLYAESHAG